MATKANDDSSLSHTRWNCKYHIVFIPKYRRKEVYGKLRSDIGMILRQLCEYKNVDNRSTRNEGSYPYVGKDTTKTGGIKLHGILKR